MNQASKYLGMEVQSGHKRQVFFVVATVRCARIALGVVLLATVSWGANPIGSEPMTLPVSGTNDKLEKVTLIRFSKDLNRWVGDFRAKATGDARPEVSVMVISKGGLPYQFTARPDKDGDHQVDIDGKFNPQRVTRFYLSALEPQVPSGEVSPEGQRIIDGCHALYRRTANKKMGDLTMAELQQVKACETVGFYSK